MRRIQRKRRLCFKCFPTSCWFKDIYYVVTFPKCFISIKFTVFFLFFFWFYKFFAIVVSARISSANDADF